MVLSSFLLSFVDLDPRDMLSLGAFRSLKNMTLVLAFTDGFYAFFSFFFIRDKMELAVQTRAISWLKEDEVVLGMRNSKLTNNHDP